MQASTQPRRSSRRKQLNKTTTTGTWTSWNPGKYGAVCFIDLETPIDAHHFACGHVVAQSVGGGDEIPNLRPVCTSCNSSERAEHMYDFIRQTGAWVGKANPYLKTMLQNGEDPLLLYPERYRTPQLRHRIAALGAVLELHQRLRDVDSQAPLPAAARDAEADAESAATDAAAQSSVHPQTRRARVRARAGRRHEQRGWRAVITDALHRRSRANQSDIVTMAQLKAHEVPTIVRELGWTTLTPVNSLAQKLQLLRDAGMIAFVDNAGTYKLNAVVPAEVRGVAAAASSVA
jgi:hypothetical protein